MFLVGVNGRGVIDTRAALKNARARARAPLSPAASRSFLLRESTSDSIVRVNDGP